MNKVDKVPYTAPGEAGSGQGRVWINRRLSDLPEMAQGSQSRQLTYADLTHYKQIVSALSETIRLMSEVDAAINGCGGWAITQLNSK